MSSISRRSSSRNQKEDEKIKNILFDSKVNPYEKVMNEYEQNKRECNQMGNAHQKQQLMKEAGRGNNVKRSTGIPRSFLQAASADTPGAKINPQGKFVLHFFQ